jgi:hypothetical protein
MKENFYKETFALTPLVWVEVVLADGTRCDCVTDTHAVELDFGSNWAEAIIMSIPYRFDYSTNKLINHLTTSLYWNP